MSQRKKINQQNEQHYNTDEKDMNVVYDGKQYLIRIPKDISDTLEIKKGDKFKFIITYPENPIPINKSNLEIKYVRSDEKKK